MSPSVYSSKKIYFRAFRGLRILPNKIFKFYNKILYKNIKFKNINIHGID